jgi:3-hydroxyisobutyrate dehydrogenase
MRACRVAHVAQDGAIKQRMATHHGSTERFRRACAAANLCAATTKREETAMAKEQFGFIGLGNMGQPMAGHVKKAGHDLIVHDLAGTADRAPEGARIAQSNAEVARQASVLALSLPTVAANRAVVEEIVEAGNAGSVVIDTCTIGPDAAAKNAAKLKAAGIAYVDAPVSGLKARADEGTLASMIAGSDADIARARPLIEAYSRVVFVVGDRTGQGQRMKVVNNAIYISTLVTVSEALAFGEHGGLDLQTMLDVVNASSGQCLVTQQVFPTYMMSEPPGISGAEALVLKKDLSLFVEGAAREGTPNAAIAKAYETIAAFSDADPRQDKAEIYKFIFARE